VVAVLRRPLDHAQLAELGAHALDLGVDLVVADDGARHRHPQVLVAGHGHVGPHLHHGVERHRPGLLAGGDVDVGGGDDVDVVLAHGLGEVVGQRLAQRLLPGHVPAEAGLEDPARRLAGPEARDPDLPRDPAEGVVDRPFELRLVDLDGQLDLVALKGLEGGPHKGGSVLVVARSPGMVPRRRGNPARQPPPRPRLPKER
jgi:hypothetical protein